MGDYMFMLESHLSPAQIQALNQVRQTALDAGLNIYITGGAMRDMLAGFPIRNLDFTLEGKTLKLAKKLTDISGAELVDYDNNRHIAHLVFPGPVPVRISMARKETYPKAGGAPKVATATIHDDLLGRDFTVNAVALSLNPASTGLLIDPANGLADLEKRELSTTYNYSFYDDPIRMVRLIRYEIRLGFAISEKTQRQFENARLANVEEMIPAYKLRTELRHIANDPNCGAIVAKLEALGFLKLFGFDKKFAKTTITALGKFEKVRYQIPPGVVFQCNYLPLFLTAVTEGFTPKQKTAFAEHLEMEEADVQAWLKLPANAGKLEKKLMASRSAKPEDVFLMLSTAVPEEVVYLYLHSKQRLAQDRIKSYLQRYLWIAQEITDAEIEAEGGKPGTPKFEKVKAQLVGKRLRARPKKGTSEFGMPEDEDDFGDEEDAAAAGV